MHSLPLFNLIESLPLVRSAAHSSPPPLGASQVGYGDIAPKDHRARFSSVFLIPFGLTILGTPNVLGETAGDLLLVH